MPRAGGAGALPGAVRGGAVRAEQHGRVRRAAPLRRRLPRAGRVPALARRPVPLRVVRLALRRRRNSYFILKLFFLFHSVPRI